MRLCTCTARLDAIDSFNPNSLRHAAIHCGAHASRTCGVTAAARRRLLRRLLSVVPGVADPATVSATDGDDVGAGEDSSAGEAAARFTLDRSSGTTSSCGAASGVPPSEGAASGAANLMLERSDRVELPSVGGVCTRWTGFPAGRTRT